MEKAFWLKLLSLLLWERGLKSAAKAAYDNYSQGCGLTDIQNQITEAVKQETMKKMRVFGSAGRG